MRGRLWRGWLVATLGGFLSLGCEKEVVKPSYPPDPVLVSKHAVEGKPTRHASAVVVRNEPASPPLPESALATAPPSLSSVARTTAAKPLSPPPSETKPETAPAPGPGPLPLPAVPAVQTKLSPPPPPTPAVHRPVGGTYGHGSDYVWLQGVLDRHFLGHADLRFCDPSEDDECGGKVCLGDDPRLKQFQDGDVLFVEGELVENGQTRHGKASHYPLYRVRSVELVQHKQ